MLLQSLGEQPRDEQIDRQLSHRRWISQLLGDAVQDLGIIPRVPRADDGKAAPIPKTLKIPAVFPRDIDKAEPPVVVETAGQGGQDTADKDHVSPLHPLGLAAVGDLSRTADRHEKAVGVKALAVVGKARPSRYFPVDRATKGRSAPCAILP